MDTLIWTEHRNPSSYLSTLVKDVMNLIVNRLNGSLARLRWDQGTSKFTMKNPNIARYVYQRRDGQVVMVGPPYQGLNVYLQGQLIYSEPAVRPDWKSDTSFTLGGNFATCQINNGFIFGYGSCTKLRSQNLQFGPTGSQNLQFGPTGSQNLQFGPTGSQKFDFELLTCTSIENFSISFAYIWCLDEIGLIYQIEGEERYQYHPYQGLSQILPSGVNFEEALGCDLAYPYLAILNRYHYVCWDLRTQQLIIQQKYSQEIDWELHHGLLLISQLDDHRVLDLQTNRIICRYKFPHSLPYQYYLYLRDGEYQMVIIISFTSKPGSGRNV